MRWLGGLLVMAGCGRLSFDARTDVGADAGDPDGSIDGATSVSIVSPLDGSEVGATVMLTGACDTAQPLALSGAGLAAPPSTPCVAGTYSVLISFTAGDGVKVITVTQQNRDGTTTSVMRSFLRVSTPLVTFRSSAGASIATQGDQVDCTLTVPRPAGVVANDVLIGVIYTDGSTNASLTTAGFTRVALDGGTYAAFYKVAGAAEPAQYAFDVHAGLVGGTCESAAVVGAFANVNLTTPIDAHSTNITTNASSFVALGVTATAPGLLIAAFGANGPSAGLSVPAGMTSDASASAQISWGAARLAWQSIPAGPTGDRTSTIAMQRDGAAALIVLRP
ncbi:MAG: hypothetical protein IPQ07_09630 [Myxococcales bacterium]|nr:hypothetical protein [Myxococcales bacterium]